MDKASIDCFMTGHRRCSSDLDDMTELAESMLMKFSGHIQNGVVVFDHAPALPEGTPVTILVGMPIVVVRSQENRQRIEFPLVPSVKPGSVNLTNTMIGEILDDEDAAR